MTVHGNRTQEERVVARAIADVFLSRVSEHSLDITVQQNQPMRLVRSGRMIVPDILVIGPGGTVAVEVDGATHHKRWVADRSRDYLLEDSGIPTYRIAVEDVADPAEVEVLVARVLRRVLGRAA